MSEDLLAQLFKFSACDDLRGNVLLLGASNVPERLDPTWHDRFVIVHFLELLPDVMCKLFAVFQRRVIGKLSINPEDSKIIEASHILHQKGASPRKVLDIVNHALLFSQNGELSSDYILSAANDYVGSANPMKVAYTSLVAISLTLFFHFFPGALILKNTLIPGIWKEWLIENLVVSIEKNFINALRNIESIQTYNESKIRKTNMNSYL